MDKKTYLSIRNGLDFSPKPAILLAHIAQDLAIMASVSGLLWGKTIWGYALAQILLACFYFRCFSIMHDAVHGSLAKQTGLNDWLGILYGGLCFLPFTTWKSVHLEHHAWAGNISNDPVMRIVRDFPNKSAFRKKLDTYLWRSWMPYVAALQELLFWTVSVAKILENNIRAHQRVQLAASVLAPLSVAMGLVMGGHALGSALFFLPSIMAYLVMVEIINFPHHLRLPRLTGEGKLNLWEQYRVSRTCIYASWFSRLVTLNFNYHAEHHMFPTLPWHELPKAHSLVMESKPNEYQMCQGHEWIRANRRKDLSEVFAPTKHLGDGAGSPSRAA
jgi:fatty acid desaturase